MGETELLHAPEVIIPAAEQMILCASARVMVAQLDERKRERETRMEIRFIIMVLTRASSRKSNAGN